MPLDPGYVLGSHEILSLIGKGGMGEVYRARDTRLCRDVAIKVLPDELARDEERLNRFEREARLLAQLNHPNIATLHGLEEHDGRLFLVMELVEGETLSERISGGAIPVEEATPLFVQMAEGLEAAHEKGIIHRDLKPANVKIGPDGQLKILDFGLAKVFVGDDEMTPDASHSPTLTRGTAVGVIMGTASYMSPEQARGKLVDKRTDVWALGCCLYEALTGVKAFEGETVSDTLSLILQREPDWSRLPQRTPPTVARVLKRCLEKDVRQRIRDVGDLRIELNDRQVDLAPAPAKPRSLASVVAVLALGVMVGMALMRLVGPSGARRSLPRSANAAMIDLSTAAPVGYGASLGLDSTLLALSPDGRELVYVGKSERGGSLLLRRSLASFDPPQPIAGTEGAEHVFFSPDGEWIGFLTESQIKRVSISGDEVRTVAASQNAVTAFWTKDDWIYVNRDGAPLSRVRSLGGEVEVVAESLDRFWVSDVHPDGLWAFANERRTLDYGTIFVVDLETAETSAVFEGGYGARWLATGHIVFARGGNLLAAAFDPETHAMLGEPVVVVRGVAMDNIFGHVQFAVSSDGTLVYVPGRDRSVGVLVLVDRDGHESPLPVEPRSYGALDLSPDDRYVAVQVHDRNDYVWIYDLERGEGRRLLGSEDGGWPKWSHDSSEVAWGLQESSESTLLSRKVSGEGGARTWLSRSSSMAPSDWSSDGIVAVNIWGEGDFGFVSLDSPSSLDVVSSPNSIDWGPVFSPDGQWLAYGSDEASEMAIWVRSYPDGTFKRQLSLGGGLEPVWCPCGEVFYRDGSVWWGTEVTLGPEISWSRPQQRFTASEFIDTGGRSYDVTSDGQRLIYVRRAEPTIDDRIHVVSNWLDELERLVPTKR